MVFLILIAFVFWIGYLVGKSNAKQKQQPTQSNQTSQLQTIYDLASRVISSAPKKLDTETLVVLYAIQYVTNSQMSLDYALETAKAYVASLKNTTQAKSEVRQRNTSLAPSTTTSSTQQSYASLVETPPTHTPIDKTSQLLYFGAFLLVTSIGLFVGFAEVEGVLKVFLLSLVALILYSTGDYLYSRTKSLQSVGTTFISVALVSIPFIGIATHAYMLDGQYAEVVWMATSLISFSAYLFSVRRYKQYITGYLLIASSVSSLLSVVGVLALPPYVFFWMLIATALLLKLYASKYHSDTLIAKPAEQFAFVLLPLALFGSLSSVVSIEGRGSELFVNQDVSQLAVSLGLATLYAYTGSKTETEQKNAEAYRQAIHPLAVATLATAVYSYDNSWMQTGVVLQLLSIAYISANVFIKHHFTQSYEPTLLAVSFFSVILSLSSPVFTTVGIGIAIILASSLALRTKNSLYATVASTLLLMLSVVVGQYLLEQRFSHIEQTLFSSGTVLILLSVSLLFRLKESIISRRFVSQVESVALFGIVGTLLLAITTFDEGFMALYGSIWFSLLLLYWLAIKKLSSKEDSGASLGSSEWLIATFVVLYTTQLSILLTSSENSLSYDVSATLGALAASILGALLTRAPWTRWTSTVQWLLIPLVFAYTETLGASFSLPSISIMYGLVAFFLMGSRLIALGRVQEYFSKKSIISLMGGQSISYMIGFYICVAIISVYSIFADFSSLWQALLLSATTMVLLWYLSYVERYKNASVIIPIAMQLIIGRLLWPHVSLFENYSASDAWTLLPAASTITALASYGYFYSLAMAREQSSSTQMSIAVLTSYISPFSVFLFFTQTWSMAIGLVVAGMTTLHFVRQRSLQEKELAGLAITLGLMWFIAHIGITNVIVHTHIVASLLALYAVIRDRRADSATSNNYSLLATLALTVPLVLAALSLEGIYSLLLLFEMSGLFILGLFVNRKHIYRVGLYTAVGALAYQLRSYGYAVVALIAIVVIGFAIHSALKQDKDKQ